MTSDGTHVARSSLLCFPLTHLAPQWSCLCQFISTIDTYTNINISHINRTRPGTSMNKRIKLLEKTNKLIAFFYSTATNGRALHLGAPRTWCMCCIQHREREKCKSFRCAVYDVRPLLWSYLLHFMISDINTVINFAEMIILFHWNMHIERRREQSVLSLSMLVAATNSIPSHHSSDEFEIVERLNELDSVAWKRLVEIRQDFPFHFPSNQRWIVVIR